MSRVANITRPRGNVGAGIGLVAFQLPDKHREAADDRRMMNLRFPVEYRFGDPRKFFRRESHASESSPICRLGLVPNTTIDCSNKTLIPVSQARRVSSHGSNAIEKDACVFQRDVVATVSDEPMNECLVRRSV